MEVDKETGEVKVKGKGSFWITKKAIKTLLAYKATAMQINAYLVLAKHTNEGGKLSTSGIKAIHTATGASHPVIEKAVELLTKMVLVNDNGEAVNPINGIYRYIVYTAEGWTKATGEVIPDAPLREPQLGMCWMILMLSQRIGFGLVMSWWQESASLLSRSKN
ncbi:MAG: hypothetical protein H0X02_00300 [Nitrosomonas sp.]|nr:hypothetical protein [Nitrosomonas sp.]